MIRSLHLLLLILCACSTARAEAAAQRPNILFILVDDMGCSDGGCFGSRYYQTRAMDSLAASGLRFTQAYASCAVCSPTRAAIQTGKNPARLHVTDWIGGEPAPKGSKFRLPDWTKRLPAGEVTLAERLKQLGYATGYIGKWHLGGGASLPERRGYDMNVAGGEPGHPASYFWPYGPQGHPNRVPGLAEAGGEKGEYLTDRLTDEALRFLDSHRDRPFFLQLSHYAVHSPLQGKAGDIAEASERKPSDGQGNATYSAMLTEVDRSLDRLMKALDRLGIADHTIVVFTSDNGGAVHFGNPPATANIGLRKGKGYAYEGGLRVPLLMRVPGMTRAGSVCAAPVISTDFFPTLLELAGAPAGSTAAGPDGTSLVPLLRGGASVARAGMFWHYPHYWNNGDVTPYSVVREGDWKLIRFYESGREELYQLSEDPSESHDLAAAQADRRGRLARRLDAWLHEVGAQMPVPRG